MRTPDFWQRKGLLSTVLLPASGLYYAGFCLRQWLSRPEVVSVPVICIGNATAGGGGKTPLALALGQYCKEKNIRAFFVSRGYGGNLRAPTLIDLAKHSEKEAGDEPLLLARVLPTVVAKNRLAGAFFAAKQGATLIIMDDGFQNPTFAKTLSLLVMRGEKDFGNGRLLPAGPLREPLASAFSRADAVVVIDEKSAFVTTNKPVICAHTLLDFRAKEGTKYFAFAGIARPERFFASLTATGANVVETAAFADHYFYTAKDITRLQARASALSATLVTTEKDAVRLPEAFRTQVMVAQMRLQFDTPQALERLLDKAGIRA